MIQSLQDVEMNPATVELSERERHLLLAEERRRKALDELTGRTAPVELTELGRAVAVRESDAGGPDEETVERVALTLHHVHLPKLAQSGIIEYDTDDSRIESCPRRSNR